MNPDQITDMHRARKAYVYIRQSSDRQVAQNKESQRRQRGLVDRAVELGWPSKCIVQIDEDLGVSADRSKQRNGFDKMVAECALMRVGIILALEVSRLCRGNRDWYHLLDICAITNTLIVDGDGLYDPGIHNDRLILGLKGTMSEVELHTLKQRMVEAIRAKAARGEFRFRLPPGFIWDAAGQLVKTPDEQVCSTIALIFERFEDLGSVNRVHASLLDGEIQVPTFVGGGRTLRWTTPNYHYVLRVLRNPLYAGAYAFGRTQVEEVLDESQRPRKRYRQKARSDWHVLIHDHHEGYISWNTYDRNQRQIMANRSREPHVGAAREGRALLQGLVFCGRCGRRMATSYSSRTRAVRYGCRAQRLQNCVSICQEFTGTRLERKVEELVLEVLEPVGMEAMIEAARAQTESCESERRLCQQRVERAQYEVDLARRQYEAVDPANRLVARQLERRYEKGLENLQQVDEDAKRRIDALERPLSSAEEMLLRRCGRDLRMLWGAETTSPQEKKRLTRALIESVVVTDDKAERKLSAEVHWIAGEVTSIEIEHGRTGVTRHAADAEIIELIRTLAREFSDVEIARILNRQGIRTPSGLTFTANRVGSTRRNHGIENGPAVPRRGPDVYSPHQAAELLGVTHTTVIRWVEAGLLRGTQVMMGAPWRIQVTNEDLQRLQAADGPEGWLPLKGAAKALGISQQAVLQRLHSGKLEGVRVTVGRRSGWRINVPKRVYDDQPSLF